MSYLSVDSPSANRFLSAVEEGVSLKKAARSVGVHLEVGYRWLRERYVQLRGQGFTPRGAMIALGTTSSRAAGWEAGFQTAGARRHQAAAPAWAERAFWAAYEAGQDIAAARQVAGVGRSTGYRWVQARFEVLRQDGASLATAAAALRVSTTVAARWEQARLAARRHQREVHEADLRRVVVTSARFVELEAAPGPRAGQVLARRARYWELMATGVSSTQACRLLGVNRHTGYMIRAHHPRSAAERAGRSADAGVGRYLSLSERRRIGDLRQIGLSGRAIAAHLGRCPSTISRELARHRDGAGRYLPHHAQARAVAQRARPRVAKLVANERLRRLVQRKLNRYWSPEQISGWLASIHPGQASMLVCPETIYRALLVPGTRCLHRRYCAKLRTGRTMRRAHGLSGLGRGKGVQNMTMIDARPPEVAAREQVGHWEGDLIVGAMSGSAMVTLRERVTQFGMIINLPHDHTAASVNAAVATAFATLPAHLARTLTWDQGVEMAAHRALAATTGVAIYFAERASPWQRGANENFNGLARQFFPEGTDLSVHTDEHVKAVVEQLNTRPRKGLGYKTPAAVLRRAYRLRPPAQPASSDSTPPVHATR